MPFLVITILWFIYHLWFTTLPLSSGDWPYLFAENIKEFSWLPEIRFLWLAPYYQIMTKISVQYLNIPWAVTEKIFWFGLFILISFFSSYKLTKSVLGSLIYVTNTYALMIVGGGQMGIAMAYALAPLVLHRFISDGIGYKKILASGLLLAIQTTFDPRIASITFFASIIYFLLDRKRMYQWLWVLGSSIIIDGFINLYWIVPLIHSKAPIARQLNEATAGSVKFLSFATFEQTISLLHPNWPENIFGKIHFMQPEFLILPIIAFSSLLIKPVSRKTLCFALLGLLGGFLAKGTNPPFGELYSWLFTHIPGFSLFRDPTKFYIFPVISFSILIPMALEKVKRGKMVKILFIVFWMFTIRQALLGQLTGTFRPMPVPEEYIKLKNFLLVQPNAFQTLWIPERQRFGFYSNSHLSLDARLLSKESSISGIVGWFEKEEARKEIVSKNVRYVIVPFDSRGELFLTDRAFDERLFRETVASVSAIPWLRRVSEFSQIAVFEVKR